MASFPEARGPEPQEGRRLSGNSSQGSGRDTDGILRNPVRAHNPKEHPKEYPMRKWKILLGALALVSVAIGLWARDQVNRDIIRLKSGRVIPVDRVWESGADLFYENDQEIHFVSLGDIQSIEKQGFATWLHTIGARLTSLADGSVNALNGVIRARLGLTLPPNSARWLLVGTLVFPVGLVPAVRWARKRSRAKKPACVAAPAKQPCPEMPSRADVVRFFLGLYRQQLGFGPETPTDFVLLSSAAAGVNQTYDLRVKSGDEWIRRRMTLGPLGEDSGSKSTCYYVIFDRHLVVKIPPKPIVDFED